jgi:lysophospholipase L1-like esterase
VITKGVISTALLLSCTAPKPENENWVATWQGPPQRVETRNLPPAPGLRGTTLRQTVHLTLGGTRFRLRLSNEYSDGPITIQSTRVARSIRRDTVDAHANVSVTFSGSPSITITAGEFAWSDPFTIDAPAFSNLTISTYATTVSDSLTGHPGSRMTSFILPGDHTGDATLPNAVATEHWYAISGLETLRSAQSAGIVILGNSIADGRGSTTDMNDRWPDNLARRLQANAATAHVGVLNAGIGGNAVVRGGLGPTAVARFDRDVLGQRGAKWLIVSEGVNDIGGARGDEGSAQVAHDLIDGYKQFIARAHARGMRAYGATMLPFNGSQYGSAAHEAARATVNAFIRDSNAFDAVIDLDAAMRDPRDPTRLRHDADSGDHLHPNSHGYQIMANAIDLTLFTRPTGDRS